MSAECIHEWKRDPIVMDFGEFGIRTRTCLRCGLVQESDPFTGRWPE